MEVNIGKINLPEILRGHVGEEFFSPIHGNVTLSEVYDHGVDCSVVTRDFKDIRIYFDGTMHQSGMGDLYPSREAFDANALYPCIAWEEWENSHECGTWEELEALSLTDAIRIDSDLPYQGTNEEESALALAKMRRLIDTSYGGNPAFEEKRDGVKEFYFVDFDEYGAAKIVKGYECIDPIAFYTKEQAERFISHPENVELLKSYYFI